MTTTMMPTAVVEIATPRIMAKLKSKVVFTLLTVSNATLTKSVMNKSRTTCMRKRPERALVDSTLGSGGSLVTIENPSLCGEMSSISLRESDCDCALVSGAIFGLYGGGR